MNPGTAPSRIAIIGAGIAGSACAQALAEGGRRVHVLDKSRGPGGRLATRRAGWLGPQGEQRWSSFDHGAPGFVARDAAFRALLGKAAAAGVLVDWSPTLARGSRPLDSDRQRHLPAPDMPALCRWLLKDVSQDGSFEVRRLHRDALGWQLESASLQARGPFDQVVLAIPPAQAAPLLAGFRPDWAALADRIQMQPCWTLMGVTDLPPLALEWDIAQPQAGLLATVLRQDARPGRSPSPGESRWVLHADAVWSREHLEKPAAWVQTQMQAALQAYIAAASGAGPEVAAPAPLQWRHAVAHRWRYAQAQVSTSSGAPSPLYWWDEAQGLGVCGDFLGIADGVGGVECAWLSAQALVEHMNFRGHAAP
jgi:predicted NAD/FAD-dependent oxidoreductase